MKYSLGDKFIVNGVEGTVAYINDGKAWLVPCILEDNEDSFDGKPLLKGVVFTKIDSVGLSNKGDKAYPIVNTECQAV